MTQFTLENDPFFAEDLLQMEKAVNYRRWQFSIVAPHVKGRVLAAAVRMFAKLLRPPLFQRHTVPLSDGLVTFADIPKRLGDLDRRRGIFDR